MIPGCCRSRTSDAVIAADASPGGDVAKGKTLFTQNCAACHALNRKMTGPALA
ncbi:MAG: c-type cytochrome, partial [Flavobacteriales bacterium]